MEFIEDGKNGFLFDFYSTSGQVEKIEYVLDNKEMVEPVRQAARKTIVDNYNLKDLLPKHIEFIKSVANM